MMKGNIPVSVYKVHKDAVIPFKGTSYSACYDICACFHTETVKTYGRNMGTPVENFDTPNAYVQMFPGEMMLIPTGMRFILPPTHHLKFYSRSGNTWKRRLKVSNSPAVIDSDYTLESFVLLENDSDSPAIIKHGEAIAQMEILKNRYIEFAEIDKETLDSFIEGVELVSERTGGLGSTDGKGGVTK